MFNYEKWCLVGEVIQDPSVKEAMSFIISMCVIYMSLIFVGYILGQFFPFMNKIFDKCKMLIKRRKTGYTTFCVWLSKDEIIMLKYALIKTGDLDLSQLNDKLSDVLLDNGYSPHVTAYRYDPHFEVITYDEFNQHQQKKGETDDKE